MKPASFWKHEWEKHGTCASILESMNTEKKYFQKGIDLLDEYDMKNVLGKASIYPGNQYPVQFILDGIKKILDVNAQVMCVKHPVRIFCIIISNLLHNWNIKASNFEMLKISNSYLNIKNF